MKHRGEKVSSTIRPDFKACMKTQFCLMEQECASTRCWGQRCCYKIAKKIHNHTCQILLTLLIIWNCSGGDFITEFEHIGKSSLPRSIIRDGLWSLSNKKILTLARLRNGVRRFRVFYGSFWFFLANPLQKLTNIPLRTCHEFPKGSQKKWMFKRLWKLVRVPRVSRSLIPPAVCSYVKDKWLQIYR